MNSQRRTRSLSLRCQIVRDRHRGSRVVFCSFPSTVMFTGAHCSTVSRFYALGTRGRVRKLPRRHRNARVTNGFLQECRAAVTWQAPCKSEAGGEPAMVIKVHGGTELQHGETL